MAVMEMTVAKAKPSTQASEHEPTLSVKLPESLVLMARVISGIDNLPVSKVIEMVAREPLDRWEKEALEKRAKVRKGRE